MRHASCHLVNWIVNGIIVIGYSSGGRYIVIGLASIRAIELTADTESFVPVAVAKVQICWFPFAFDWNIMLRFAIQFSYSFIRSSSMPHILSPSASGKDQFRRLSIGLLNDRTHWNGSLSVSICFIRNKLDKSTICGRFTSFSFRCYG